MTDWQPISTAPKDGTVVLLYAPEWTALSTGWTFGNDPWQDCPYDYSGKQSGWDPTHWMPLPDPPLPNPPKD